MNEPGLWLIAFLLLAGIGLVVTVVVNQSRAERRDAAQSGEDQWRQLQGAELSRSDFCLYRIIPTQDWRRAAYIFQDENHEQVGSYVSQSRVRADLELRDKKYQMYIQRAGAFASKWSGKVGASSPSGIVVRTADQVIVELLPVSKFPSWRYQFATDGQQYRIENGGWSGAKPRKILRNSEVCGLVLRPGFTSRTVLLALRRDLPDAAFLAIMVASLLQ